MIHLEKLTEPELKKLCYETMSPHFRMLDGDGANTPACVHFHSGRLLRPDFICFPLKPLRANGWPDWMFYIEIKDAIRGNGASRITETAWQAKTYNDCVCNFRLPAFSLVFPNFQTFFKNCTDHERSYAEWFAGYMQRERVGELFINPQGQFKIKFLSGVLYDHADGRCNFNLLDRQHRGVCQ